MKRKDYELIAAAIASEKTVVESLERVRASIAKAICYRLQEDNPYFNNRQFLKACFIEQEVRK